MNTKLFYMSAIAIGKVKKVTKLVSDSGYLVMRQEDLCDVAKNYFYMFFVAKNGNHAPVLDLLKCAGCPGRQWYAYDIHY